MEKQLKIIVSSNVVSKSTLEYLSKPTKKEWIDMGHAKKQ